ncbi:MAG TPA: hypothetical protein VKA84_01960 [Gemmatimonadaceae bacterium]|nr:hypothetical protein [Gemmatimonadaceae bacterium]
MRGARLGRTAAAALVLTLAACGSDSNVQQTTRPGGAQPAPAEGAWRAVATKKIYFGHQSVGGNILDGVRELMAAEGAAVRLNIVHGDDPSAVQGPALVESFVGENGDPESKGAAFAAALDRGMGAAGGVALYKHCYLDVGPGTDVRQMFERYRARTAELRAKYPGLVLAHVTVPLTTADESPVKRLLKTVLRKPTVVEVNAKRNAFNALLRGAYAGREPLFDLAAIESTRPDGSRSYVTLGADTVYTLVPEYTDDGGHLNAAGRRAAATRFVEFLAGL